MVSLGGMIPGRAELRGGKRHGAEDGTGVILLGRHALLVGHTVLGCVDQILGGAYQPHQGKDP